MKKFKRFGNEREISCSWDSKTTEPRLGHLPSLDEYVVAINQHALIKRGLLYDLFIPIIENKNFSLPGIDDLVMTKVIFREPAEFDEFNHLIKMYDAMMQIDSGHSEEFYLHKINTLLISYEIKGQDSFEWMLADKYGSFFRRGKTYVKLIAREVELKLCLDYPDCTLEELVSSPRIFSRKQINCTMILKSDSLEEQKKQILQKIEADCLETLGKEVFIDDLREVSTCTIL
jgi:hypothetical protein